jgi:hypothetical protein
MKMNTKMKIFLVTKNVTVTKFAKLAGKTFNTMSRKINNKTALWTYNEIYLLARYLNIPMEDFYEVINDGNDGGE